MLSSNLHSAQFLGMVNALRTGDPTIDMFVAMMFPLVMGLVVQQLPKLLASLAKLLNFAHLQPIYRRTISYRCSHNSSSGLMVNLDEDSYNAFLIKAINLYVHNQCKLQLDDADMQLTTIDSKGGTALSRLRNQQNGVSTVGMLADCEIVERPVQRQWHNIGTFAGSHVHIFMNENVGTGEEGSRQKNDTGGGNNTMSVTEIQLKSTSGTEPINAFVNEAYDWYSKELKRLESSDRYLFDLRSAGQSVRSGSSTPSYTRFKLGDEKTFESLFSEQCQSLVKMVDQFQGRTGKYSIKGYPYKFGLLLSGPPGTGKTSLIKALAHYTNRHIVSVPLSRITYNAELSDVFFNKNYMVPGCPNTFKLDFDQVIFVLEDVDASSDVVKRRSLQKKKTVPQQEEEKPDDGGLFPVDSILNGLTAAPRPSSFLTVDQLDLTGLLNVLDGCVETPGRMVIMSTNHPEMLDPALIRPGRIDRQLELGYMISSDVMAMLEHYYQTALADVQKEKVEDAVSNGAQVTPAEIEQFVMQEDSVDDFIASLERRCVNTTTSTEDCSTMDSYASGSDCRPFDTSSAGVKECKEEAVPVSASDKARRERVQMQLQKEQKVREKDQKLREALGEYEADY